MRKRFSPKKLFINFAVFVLVLYGVTALMLASQQRKFLYQPIAGPIVPLEAGLRHFTAHELQTADGTRIYYWESDTKSGPTLFYFHGNGGGLHFFTPALHYFQQQGFHVVAMEYRGYPGAPPDAMQEAIIRDAIALIDAVKPPKSKSVIWGYSLGSGVAVQAAAQRDPSVLVLEAPFTAVVDRAAELFPLFPVRFLLQDQYLSREAIHNVQAPLFILHGEDDWVVPIAHGRALFAAANEPKIMRSYAGFGHLDLIDSPAYGDAVVFIRAQLRP